MDKEIFRSRRKNFKEFSRGNYRIIDEGVEVDES
jgi:hypothetical protein